VHLWFEKEFPNVLDEQSVCKQTISGTQVYRLVLPHPDDPLACTPARPAPAGRLLQRYNLALTERNNMPIRKTLLSLFLAVTLFTASCGTSTQKEAEISTAVAQTVQAQDSLTKVALLSTPTPAPTLSAESTPLPETPPAPPATQAAPAQFCTPAAVLVGENPPDKTIFRPGEYFWKTWTFVNTGTCTWDPSYSLIFWDGERMGSAVSYPLVEVVRPNETMDISIYLQAPAAEGAYTGYWRFKSPWGSDFGVGPYNMSFYTQIEVSSKPVYAITDVKYQLVRNPEEGCPVNVRYTVYATITTNGPLEFQYRWDQSDGNESGIKTIKMPAAGSKTISREWMIGRGASQNPRWIQLIVLTPKYQEYDKVTILNNCP
jgi:hypothetical protein